MKDWHHFCEGICVCTVCDKRCVCTVSDKKCVCVQCLIEMCV